MLDMGRPVNILDLAYQMIRLAGYEPEKDIPVSIVGPRPGEKLYEKLYADYEKVEPTSFEKILVVRSNTRPLDELTRAVDEIKMICEKEDKVNLAEFLKRLIPEYAMRRND